MRSGSKILRSLHQWLTKQWAMLKTRQDGKDRMGKKPEKNIASEKTFPIPKIIWVLWLQGWNQAPELVLACLATWKKHNPDWTIHPLDRSNLHMFLDNDIFTVTHGKDLEPEAFSDFIRIALLNRYGGVWVDSTVYCLKPLADWLYGSIRTAGFFAFEHPGNDRMISSWFLAACKGNYLVQQWHDQTRTYWLEHTQRDHYFWFHRLFEKIYNADEHFRDLWDTVPKTSSSGPHYYVPYKKLTYPISLADRNMLETPPHPMLKLTHKFIKNEYSSDSVFRFLCDTANVSPQHNENTFPLKPETLSMMRKILVTWYGSFGDGTIGDLLSLQSVTSHLVGKGHNVFHASAMDFHIHGAQRVDWSTISPEEFDAVIFVCGPIIKSHPKTRLLFEKFKTCHILGVGVSLFPPTHPNYMNPFNDVLAREGGAEQFEDIAILAPRTIPYQHKNLPDGKISIGVVLRGRQSEYGIERCLAEKTDEIVNEVARTIIAGRGGQVIKIENHLRRSGVTPDEIEANYVNCDLIISSRFHGAMLAVRHGIPFIAIDQIKGGAKVTALLSGLGWPHVFQIDSTSAEQILQSAHQLMGGELNKTLLDIRDRSIMRANMTLTSMDDLIENCK